MPRKRPARALACALASAAVGVWAFVQCNLATRGWFEPLLPACLDPSSAPEDVDLVPYEARLGGVLVCLGTQFLRRLMEGGAAGFVTWTALLVVLLPLNLLMIIEAGRSGARGPVRYPTVLTWIGQAIGASVSFPVLWVPSMIYGGGGDGAVATWRPYVATLLVPPGVALSYLVFELDVEKYSWTLVAGMLLGPFGLPLLNAFLLPFGPKSAATAEDAVRGAEACANCYLLVSLAAFPMWLTVLSEVVQTYGLSGEAIWDGLWTDGNEAVRFMVIDAVGLFAAGLCYVASVDPMDAVVALAVTPVVGPGTSVGSMLWGQEKLRADRARIRLARERKKRE